MIGFFDSGFGGLTILKEVVGHLPQYSYIYLGDNARAPYGSRTPEQIYDYTVEGIRTLFGQGAQLVILACNTSSAVALRKIQQLWLPQHFPEKKVLGIIRPTAEEVGRYTASQVVGVMATEATINSSAYQKEIAKIDPRIEVIGQACPLFVPAIEAGRHLEASFALVIQECLQELLRKSKELDAIILGCTHFPIIEQQIQEHLPQGIRLISQGPVVAEKLVNYLERHPEVEQKLKRDGKRSFFTTAEPQKLQALAELFYGQAIELRALN